MSLVIFEIILAIDDPNNPPKQIVVLILHQIFKNDQTLTITFEADSLDILILHPRGKRKLARRSEQKPEAK